jgi:apolipoprotein N-acyltransferase
MLLIDRESQIIGQYSKVHLVPFGEYVPYRKFLFFAERLVEAVGDFVAGKGVEPIFTDNFQIGGLVCYEDLFPEISREHVRKGANLLAVITNDAWYGRTSAAFQHIAIAVFRAVENRRWMVRSANSGVSAVIDASGRILSRTGIFEEGMIVSNVKLGKIETPYTKIGDWFAWACILVFVTMLAVISKKRFER